MIQNLQLRLTSILLCGCLAFIPPVAIERLSLDMVAKTLYQGKSVTGVGTVYYKVQGGLMVTRINSPLDQITITNATGEYKSYDPRTNTVTMMQGAELSSRNSFIYSFLSGKSNDMGITALGFKVKNSRMEKGLAVVSYSAPTDRKSLADRIDIAYENQLPIFMGFYDAEGKAFQKTYYTNYQHVGYTKMPFTITEIDYLAPNDSSITRRTYSNLKVNGDVETTWLNYTIPTNAKVVAPLQGPNAKP